MIDFKKLRSDKQKQKPVHPLEIFRRLPKPVGFNDLYTSQAEVLEGWFDRRTSKDTVIKLHTGGGKTIVGLLIAQSSLNEASGPVLYLAPTAQLVKQTLDKAKSHGIPAVPYVKGKPLDDEFVNGKAILVASYQALFNGQSLFGVRGKQPTALAAIVLDDAHTAFSVLRDQFTLEINKDKDLELYESLCGMFRHSFEQAGLLGTFDDVVGGRDLAILEVPYWDWIAQADTAREKIKPNASKYPFQWPLLRDNFRLCHALVSREAFTITCVLPIVEQLPSFTDCPRRIYMSATIADDSEIVRTFGATVDAIQSPLGSRSLAGVSERMILIPDLMPWSFSRQDTDELVTWTTQRGLGVVILTASEKSAHNWTNVARQPSGSADVEKLVSDLQKGKTDRAVVFANRYDGIDLPGDACRLLVMSGLPKGTSAYELFRASALFGGSTIARMLAQRIEQGIGRGARGSGDHCVVILHGSDIAGWISRKSNFRFLTNATRAQIEIGRQVSAEIGNFDSLQETIERTYERDDAWMQFHAESLADLVDEDLDETLRIRVAEAERKAFDLWHQGYCDKAISKLEGIRSSLESDKAVLGWIEQFTARIAFSWGRSDLALDLQKHAFSDNKGLLRPASKPPYEPLQLIGTQAMRIASLISKFEPRRGCLSEFDGAVSNLNPEASANQFEQSMVRLAEFGGWLAERKDIQGEGPDVLWLLPESNGLVIEAKSRKMEKNALTKGEHGQLLVAENWFRTNYPNHNCTRVSVHPNDVATKQASADGSFALTYDSLAGIKSEIRSVLEASAESHVGHEELAAYVSSVLKDTNLSYEGLRKKYLKPFRTLS